VRKQFICGIMLLCLLLASPCFAKTLTGVANDFPPFTDPTHPKQGFSFEIARAAFESQGYTIETAFVPWARAEDGIKKGTYDFCPTFWINEERQKTILFSQPYAENNIRFIKPKGNPFEYTGLKSLEGLTVGVVRGYGYPEEFFKDPKFRTEEVNDFTTNVRKLLAGRIDLTLEDEIVARSTLLREAPELLEQIEFTSGSLTSEKLYVGCGLTHPEHQAIIESFNKGLEEIKQNGTYEAILASYGF